MWLNRRSGSAFCRIYFIRRCYFYEFEKVNGLERGTAKDFFDYVSTMTLWCDKRGFTFTIMQIRGIQKLSLG